MKKRTSFTLARDKHVENSAIEMIDIAFDESIMKHRKMLLVMKGFI